MAQEIKVKLKEAYDTEANWKAKNPVLLAGQLAYSSDKYGKYKIGDGTKTWSQLGYSTLAWGDITGKPSTFTPATHTHDDRYYTETEMNAKLDTKANTSHSHNYAGSTSPGGSANSAVTASKLGTATKGSATQPIYLNAGVPTACTYTLGKSVPSNAVFTDTNTWIALKGATTTTAGTAGYAPAPSAGSANRYLRSDGTWSVPPNTTYSAFKGATASANGTTGLVPAPLKGGQTKWLRADGTWQSITASQITDLPNIVAITNSQIDSLKNL